MWTISSAADAVSNGGPLISSPDPRTAWHTLRILRWLLWAARYRSVQGNFGVARIIGIPEATVKIRMFCARKKLAELVSAA